MVDGIVNQNNWSYFHKIAKDGAECIIISKVNNYYIF